MEKVQEIAAQLESEIERAREQQRAKLREAEEARLQKERAARNQEFLGVERRLQECQTPSVQRWSNVAVSDELSERFKRAKTQEGTEADITDLREAVEKVHRQCSSAIEGKKNELAAELGALQREWRDLPPDAQKRERAFLHAEDLQGSPSFPKDRPLPEVTQGLSEVEGRVARLRFVLGKEALIARCFELRQGRLESGTRAAINAFVSELQEPGFAPDLEKKEAELQALQNQVAEGLARRNEELRRQQQAREKFVAVRVDFEQKKEKALARAKETDSTAARVLGHPTFFCQRISKLIVPEATVDEAVVREKNGALDSILSEMGSIEESVQARKAERTPLVRTSRESVDVRQDKPKPSASVAAKSIADSIPQNTQRLKRVSQQLNLLLERVVAVQQQGRDLGVGIEENIGREIEEVSKRISIIEGRLSDRGTLEKILGCEKKLVLIGNLIDAESARLSSVQGDFQRRGTAAGKNLEGLLGDISTYQEALDRFLSLRLISQEEYTKFYGELSTLKESISRSQQQIATSKSSVERLERMIKEGRGSLVRCKKLIKEKQVLLGRIEFQIERIDGLKGKASDLERENAALQSKKKRLASARKDGFGVNIKEVESNLQGLRDQLEAVPQNPEQMDALGSDVWRCAAAIEDIRRKIQCELFLVTVEFLKSPQTDPSSLYSSADEWGKRFENARRFAASMGIVVPEFPDSSSEISYQQLNALEDAKKRRLIQVVEAFCDRQDDIREIKDNINKPDLDRSLLSSMAKNYSICRAIEQIIEGASVEDVTHRSKSEKQEVDRFFKWIESEYEKLALYMDAMFVSEAYREKKLVEGSAEMDVEIHRLRSLLPFKAVHYMDDYLRNYRLGYASENMVEDLRKWEQLVRGKFRLFLTGL
jgi:chromosome segregation ATPase